MKSKSKKIERVPMTKDILRKNFATILMENDDNIIRVADIVIRKLIMDNHLFSKSFVFDHES